jgi:hypothetical protein
VELSFAQQFELERQLRAIDGECDTEKLRSLCKDLIRSWHAQRSATLFFMKQTLPQRNAQSHQANL